MVKLLDAEVEANTYPGEMAPHTGVNKLWWFGVIGPVFRTRTSAYGHIRCQKERCFFFHLDEQFERVPADCKDELIEILPGMPVYFLVDELRPDRAIAQSMRDVFKVGHIVLAAPRWHRP